MQIITSLDNPLIKRVIQLHEKKGRKEYQQCIVEGLRACTTFFEQGLRPYHLFLVKELVDKVPIGFPEHKVIEVSERVMQKISVATTASGMLGVFHLPPPPAPSELQSGLVLAQIQDPGNMGTLIRTAVALNKRTIVIIEGVEPWSPKVVQASAGTLAMAQIFQWSWEELLAHKGSLQLTALVVSGGKFPQELDLKKSLLIVGNEANGLPGTWQKVCNALLTLPMPGGAESLNAAVAGSIALYYSSLQQ